MKYIRRATIAVAGAAVLGLSALGSTAVADPAPGEYRQLAGVGSDTTQDVVNALGKLSVDPDGKPDNQLIASYNAVGSPTIKTRKTGCGNIPRPNGSSAGITALINDIAANTKCIDFARSSRGPNDTTTTDLTWIPFAKDGVTFAVRGNSALPKKLSKATLVKVYNCVTRKLNGVTVNPLIPQAGSGTRSFWLKEMGLTEGSLPKCVSDRNGTVQEHDGRALTKAGDIMPFSIPQYITQTNSAKTHVKDRRGKAVLGTLNGHTPVWKGSLNLKFPITRDVYNVVKTSRLAVKSVKAGFVGKTSQVCKNVTSPKITIFGFGKAANCGVTILKGKS
ncbi:substrate-binding domain-containing protein [Wenjunlia tyrosinilytica]|uniref:substrate-binding domain-containing protein n=1 Tax=Wenjunlia tyrosinilytica TaxID=1544741 RepID=UPI00166A641F|nr:substrate-binding domain-containing protein [Wenjunlia tyrosinilytica]